MRKWLASMVLIIVLACGCSAAGEGKAGGANDESKPWDYGSGYVLDKEGTRLLIVSEKAEEGKAPEEVLAGGGMRAIWLAVEAEQFDAVQIGDEVRVTVMGEIAESYPEQGKGSVKVVE